MAETLSPKNYEGFYVYLTVIMLALFAHTLLTGYLVRNAQQLCIKPTEIKVNLEWKAQKFNFIAIPALFIYTIVGIHYKFNPEAFSYGFLLWAIAFGVIRKRLSPNPQKDGPLIARIFKSRKRKPKKVIAVEPAD